MTFSKPQQMRRHRADILAHAAGTLRPPPTASVTTWCEQHVYVPAPQTQSPGWFRLDAREYLREPLDTWGDPSITDAVCCFGSQTGKTTLFMAGAAWSIACDPCGMLWVMPSIDLARSFSETRWAPLVRASPDLERRIPTGIHRHDFKKTQQQLLGGALLNFIGSNSPANLASRPARRVILDEVDKFPAAETRGEADAVNLAEQRTKSFANPQRWKSSTPTMVDGLIWQEFLKGDQRRRFVPCPACGRFLLLAWSENFSIFPRRGDEASVRWDPEARRADGTWDLDRVERSAHAECPHCHGPIRDDQKTIMDRFGEWRATAPAVRGFRSWHLPSLYASSPQTTFGRLAVRFLQAKAGLLGLQGFINGDLAEPWESQESRSERVEVVSTPEDPPLPEAVPLMTVDCQAVGPYFWYVIRLWDPNGNSRLITAGHVDTWEDLRERQTAAAVADNHVGVDSGFGASTVYEQCLRWGKLLPLRSGRIHRGWTPMKGREREVIWKDKKGHPRPLLFGSAALPHHRFRLPLIEFNGDYLLDVLTRLRKGGPDLAFKWEVSADCGEEYYRHLDAKVKKVVASGVTGKTQQLWVKRGPRWPEHLLDCEVMQLAMAIFHGRLPWGEAEQTYRL